MRNVRVRSSAILLLAARVVLGQAFAPTGDAKFDAAVIRPTDPDAPSIGDGWVHPEPGGKRYIGSGLSLRAYLWVAYQVKPEQIEGGPAWMDRERFDLNAETERSSSLESLHIMLQNLLAERFHLQFHYEKKEMRAYTLSMATKAAGDNGPVHLKEHPQATGGDVFLDQYTDRLVHSRWTAHCASMDVLAWKMSLILDRPVVNQTGFEGCYNFVLTFTRDLPDGTRDGDVVDGEPVDTLGPNLREALEKQLGLKLEAGHGPVQVLVVDSAEQPTLD